MKGGVVQYKMTRRLVVKGSLMAAAAIPMLGRIGHAATAALPPLDPKDPQAVTLGYADDTTKVDAAANPSHAVSQNCANCQQFLGNPTDSGGGCVLFPGKGVRAAGWCKVWRKKP
jgi:hypothetical protein